jgi:hypothetical protein
MPRVYREQAVPRRQLVYYVCVASRDICAASSGLWLRPDRGESKQNRNVIKRLFCRGGKVIGTSPAIPRIPKTQVVVPYWPEPVLAALFAAG